MKSKSKKRNSTAKGGTTSRSRQMDSASTRGSRSTSTRGPGSDVATTRSSKSKTSNTQQEKGDSSAAVTRSTRKRKATEPNSQESKRQKTRPLTTDDIPTIVEAIRKAFPESSNPEPLEETAHINDGTDSEDSDEFGEHNIYIYNYINIVFNPKNSGAQCP